MYQHQNTLYFVESRTVPLIHIPHREHNLETLL